MSEDDEDEHVLTYGPKPGADDFERRVIMCSCGETFRPRVDYGALPTMQTVMLALLPAINHVMKQGAK